MKRRLWVLVLAALLALGILAGCAAQAPDSRSVQEDALQLIEESTPETAMPTQIAEVELSAELTQEEPAAEPEKAEPAPEPETSAAPEETSEPETVPEATPEPEPTVDEDGEYTAPEDVALYIHTFGHLPDNFITKNEAEKLGWEGGSVQKYAPECAIGGDTFGNREGLLPKKSGRFYKECDIDTLGKDSRGAKRIVFSNDGLIYYTDDHYESFTLLYGEE